MKLKKALYEATVGNLNRHRKRHWIHASLGKKKPVVNRCLMTEDGIDLTIQVYSPDDATLTGHLPRNEHIKVIKPR